MRTRSVLVWSLAFITALVLFGILPLLAQDGPSFTIIQPELNARISGSLVPIAIQFDCDADAPVVRFEAYLDSTELVVGRIRKPIAQGHFRVDGDLRQISVKAGPHLLIVKLYDIKGRVSQQQTRVILESPVLRETNPPKVRIVSPREGDVLTGATDIKVDATDDSGVKYVQIFINDKMRLYTNEAPFVMPFWNPMMEGESGSIFVLRASAADLFDNMANSLPVTVRTAAQFTQKERPPTRGPELNTGKEAEWDLLFTGHNDRGSFEVGAIRVGEFKGDPRAQILTDTDTLVALVAQDKSQPRFAEGAAAFAARKGERVKSPVLVMPAGVGRPSLTNAPLGSTQMALVVFDTNTPAAKGGIVGDTLAVAALPMLSAKMMPGTVTGDPAFGKGAGYIVVPVTLANPGSTRPFLGATPRYTPASIALGLPDAAAPAGKAYQPELALVALVPAGSMKLTPHGVRGVDLTIMRAGEKAVGVQPADRDAVARRATTVEGTLALQAKLEAIDVQKAAARGDVRTDIPLIVALVPVDAKSAPMAMTSVLFDAHTGQLVQAAQPLDALASRPAGEYGLPRLTPMRLALVDLSGAAARADSTPSFARPMLAMAGKALPAHPGTPVQWSDGASRDQEMLVLPPGGNAARLVTLANLDLRAGAGMMMPDAAVIGPRAMGPDAAAVQIARLPGKAVPAAVNEYGMLPSGGQQSTDIAPSHGATKNRPPVNIPVEDLMVDLEGRFIVGDKDTTLVEIARLHNTTPDVLEKINPGLSSDNRPLPKDTVVRVPKGTARIYLDDEPVAGGPDPFIIQGRAMVPMRSVVQAKGGVVVWVPETREVNAWADNTYLHVQIGSTEARINNDRYTLPVAPVIREASTMVPLRYMISALRMQVAYNPKTGTYYLMSQAGE